MIRLLRQRLPWVRALRVILLGVSTHCAALELETAWPITDRVHAAATYLHAQIGPDGRLVYERDARNGEVLLKPRYNVLRHAGSLLALAEYHLEYPAVSMPDNLQIHAVQSAFVFLENCCLRPSQADASDLAVWSDPRLVVGRRHYQVAKLGGAGLSLAAMAQWRRVHPAGIDLATMQALGRFILAQQDSDGRFRSLHAHHQGQHDPEWVSLYYPGEAVLGLVLLFEHDGNLQWLRAALDALLALAREREALLRPPPDHWALIATARLFRLDHGALQAASPIGMRWLPADDDTTRGSDGHGANSIAVASLLQAHARLVALTMAREQLGSEAPACARGGFAADGRTAPTATRLEGLLALLAMDPGEPFMSMLWPVVESGIGFLLTAQHQGGSVQGAFSRVSAACASPDPAARHIRIDHVQHSLSALQAYRSLKANKDQTAVKPLDLHPSTSQPLAH